MQYADGLPTTLTRPVAGADQMSSRRSPVPIPPRPSAKNAATTPLKLPPRPSLRKVRQNVLYIF